MRLTSERVNGIKTGYWSPEKKEELVQKLGAIEHKAPDLLKRCCVYICGTSEERGPCADCPVRELEGLVGADEK